ncbi:MAG: PAS domain S-box protein, partial [Pseudolabrys sp.]
VYIRVIGERFMDDALELAESSSGIGIWDADLRTQTVRGTSQFFRVMGMAPTSRPVPMDSMRALRFPEDQARVSEGYRNAIDSGEDVFESEYRIARADGDVRWIYGRGRVVRDQSGAPVRYSGVDIDITDKKRAEAALRESEARFGQIFDQSPVGKAMLGPDLNVRAVNPSLCQVLGVAEPELIGRPLSGHIHADERHQFDSIAESLVAGEPPENQLEARLLRADGASHWTRITMGPIRDSHGELLHIFAVVQDVDERRRTEEALRDSEERLRLANETLKRLAEERASQLASSRAQLQAFFDNSPDWLTLILGTPDGCYRFVEINPTSEAAYGLPRNKVVGRTVAEILGEEQARTPLHYL